MEDLRRSRWTSPRRDCGDDAVLPGIASSAGSRSYDPHRNLCARYQKVVAQAWTPSRRFDQHATADAIRARAEVALARLDELQAVSEGRYDTLISTLRAAINDVKQSAVKAGAAAAQQRQDTLQRLAEERGTAEAAAGRPVQYGRVESLTEEGNGQ